MMQGSRSRSILVYAADPKDRSRGKTGLRADVASVHASAMRAGETQPRRMTLSPGTPESYIPGGGFEVDPAAAPGVYRFGIPNTVLTKGSTQAMVRFHFPGAVIDPVEIMLVAYDPQEPERIGMECQIWEVRQEFLRQALIRLAEMELKLQQDAERTPGVGRTSHDAGP
jgi:hypothetical protein